MLLLLLACSKPETLVPPPAPRDLADLDLAHPGGSLLWRGLEHLDQATITLPPPRTAVELPERFPLTGDWKALERRVGRLRFFSHPLP